MNVFEQLREFDSAEISDAMDALQIEGVLLGIKPLSSEDKIIAPIYTVQYQDYDTRPESFKNAGNYIDDVPEGSAIVIDNHGRMDCTCWGGILTQLALDKDIAATVINGIARDIQEIQGSNYSVFAKGHGMRSGKNRVYKATVQTVLQIGDVCVSPGDILFGDQSGVVVIPRSQVLCVIKRAKAIAETENRILQAVKNGMRLDKARAQFRYDQPWLSEVERVA